MKISQKFKLHNIVQSKPLGMYLLEADLVSSFQLELALQDQSYYSNLRLGEILALRGWIKQETADFFAQDWQTLIKQSRKNPLGFYLKQSALLSEKDIEIIFQEHQQTGIRFGTVAVLKGLLKSTTLDYFLMNLCPKEMAASPFISHYRTSSRQFKPLKQQVKTNNYSGCYEDVFQECSVQPIEELENSIIWID